MGNEGKWDKVYNDYFIGNGERPMRTRVALLEERMENFQAEHDELKKSLSRFNSNLQRVLLAILAVLATMVADIIVRNLVR